MKEPLSDVELRILGSLIEKEFTTPDQYPLTLNALTNACNQKSNRHPVVAFSQETVRAGLDGLREKQLVVGSDFPGGRAYKFRHFFTERFKFYEREAAILCELMLRGPQTLGELRTRAMRMHPFQGIEEVETLLQGLMERHDPWVVKLPLQPGKKEPRYMHLLQGDPDLAELEKMSHVAEVGTGALQARVTELEEGMALLSEQMEELQREFKVFKAQFE